LKKLKDLGDIDWRKIDWQSELKNNVNSIDKLDDKAGWLDDMQEIRLQN
jgi:hypothetical protein